MQIIFGTNLGPERFSAKQLRVNGIGCKFGHSSLQTRGRQGLLGKLAR
jgi:hypothetical protein